MIDFEKIGQLDNNISKWGGKAVSLNRLGENGFRIPNGFVISSAAYDAYTQQCLNLIEFNSRVIQMCQETFGASQKQKLIIRSSANIESTDGICCSGIFESFVINERQELIPTIKRVWESVTSIRATAFYRMMNLSTDKVTMAIIVQEFCDDYFTAVIHTSDVVFQKKRVVLEYAVGQVSSVVDGYIDANTVFIESVDDAPASIPPNIISQILDDCRKSECIFGYPVELEAQIGSKNICYMQARQLL